MILTHYLRISFLHFNFIERYSELFLQKIKLLVSSFPLGLIAINFTIEEWSYWVITKTDVDKFSLL